MISGLQLHNVKQSIGLTVMVLRGLPVQLGAEAVQLGAEALQLGAVAVRQLGAVLGGLPAQVMERVTKEVKLN